MDNRLFSAYIEFRTPGRFYTLYFFRKTATSPYEEGTVEVLKMPEIVTIPEYSTWPHDCGVTLQEQTAQTLMDQLWQNGVRPSEGHGSTGQLAATEKHVESLTKINDRLLDIVERGQEHPTLEPRLADLLRETEEKE